jgi:hypothetical protein
MGDVSDTGTGEAALTEAEPRYRHLPSRVPMDELVEERAASDKPDPEMGRDPNHEWLLRGV